jgi:phospholipid-binding lipoprotein MlaA
MIISRLLLPFAILVLSGCASTSSYHNPQDPLEPLNRTIFKFNDTVDKVVLKPAAKGYNAVMPPAGRTMVHNFFSNLDDIIVTLNDLLQFKPRQAFSDGGRILINTTVGALGLVDAATAVGFPKHDEDFGQTLGYWGVENGPYLVLPILGPSTLRDSIGLYVDSRPSRLRRINHMRTRNQAYLLDAVSTRAELLEQEKVLEQAVIDRYAFIRDAYLQRRRSLVYDGNPPRMKYDDEDYEDDDSTPGGGTGPGSKAAPDKSSSKDAVPPPTVAEESTPPPAATPAAATVAEPQPPAIHRVWVVQH